MFTFTKKTYSAVIDENKGLLKEFITHDKNVCVPQGSPLFGVALRNKLKLDTFWSTDFSFVSSEQNGNKLALKYALTEKSLTATVYIEFLDDCFNMSLSVDNDSALLIDYVDLIPLTVNGKLQAEGGEGRVLYPFNEGAIYDNLDFRIHSHLDYIPPQCPSRLGGGVYPNMVESQFIAYLLDGYGIYMGMHDKTFAPKGIDFYPGDNGMIFELRYYPGLNYGESLTLSCPVIVKPFDGDWMNAGDIYKEWYEQNKPQGLTKLIDRKMPEWFLKSPTVIICTITSTKDGQVIPNNFYPYTNALKHIDKLAEQTGGPILALLMRWEGTAPWNAPFAWPPLGGENLFKEYVDALHEKGNYIGLYCSGLGFSEYSKLNKDYNQREMLAKPEIQNSLCIQPDGTPAPSTLVTFVREGFDLCIKGEKTTEIMTNEVKSIVNANVDYVQILDQNHGGNACFCYSDKHGHPVGQGAWQVHAVQDLLSEFEKIGGAEVLFGCESTSADPFLKVLHFNDARAQNNYVAGAHSIPLNNYMFHEYVNNFMGNGSWPGIVLDDKSLCYRMAYTFCQGDIIALCLNDDGTIKYGCEKPIGPSIEMTANILSMTKQMNAFRRAEMKYLVYGVSQRPDKIEFGNLTNALKHRTEGKVEVVPQLISGAFRAEDGSTAQFVVNYNENAIEFSLDEEKTIYSAPNADGVKCKKYTIAPFSVIMIK